MRGLRFFIAGLVLLATISGCRKDVPTSSQEKDAPAFSEEKDAAVKEQSRKEANMGLSLKWLGHASFRISHEDTVVYIDPWKLRTLRTMLIWFLSAIAITIITRRMISRR